jgi:hypothetical protein
MNADDQDIKKVIEKYLSVVFCGNLRPIERQSRKRRNELS